MSSSKTLAKVQNDRDHKISWIEWIHKYHVPLYQLFGDDWGSRKDRALPRRVSIFRPEIGDSIRLTRIKP